MERPLSPHGDRDPAVATLWDQHRRRMLDIAFRMLLDFGDAEDVVQEAFARLARSDITRIDDPEGWLVVVTGRLSLDRLRTRRRRPADALKPEDDLTDRRAVDPAVRITLTDNVTLALHVVLERLSPAERTSFVLHDVFQYSFDEVAAIVGRSSAACRQLASRARNTIGTEAAAARFPVETEVHRRVSERFIDACDGGDLDALLTLLDPSVSGAGDVAPDVVVGAANVAPGILRYLGPPASPTLLHIPVDDRIGIVALHGRRVAALVLLTLAGDIIVHVDAFAGEGPRAAVSAALGLT
jgi:RNA polymerase sigma-70 factor (ECF subfamily)